MSVITIESPPAKLTDELRAALAEADIIIGVDAAEREFTVFGTPPLESTCSLKKPSAMHIVRVSIDGKNWGLDRLIAAVHSVKGRER